MNTINFITSHFLPENTACTNRVLAYVDELSKNHKINIITLTEKSVIKNDTQLKVKYNNNTNIYYVNQYDFNGKNFFNRAFKEIKYISKLIKLSNNLDCSTTIVTSPYMFMIPLVGFFIKKPKVLDIRDLVWEYLSDKNIFSKLIKNTLRLIMKVSLKRFDEIIVTNDYELSKLIDDYDINNSHIIPNGIDNKKYNLLSTLNNINNIFTVTYIGNIGIAQNIQTLVYAAEKLPDIKFNIIGDGIELNKIRHYINDNSILNVELTGKLEWKDIEKYYANSSILYAQLNKEFVSAMPSKLYEYASIGLPIIYGGIGQASIFIKSLDNSINISPNNVNELILAINKLKKTDINISIHNRGLVKNNFIRELTVSKINDILNLIKDKK